MLVLGFEALRVWVWTVAPFLLFALSLTLGCGDSNVTCSAHSLMSIISPLLATISSSILGVLKVSHCEENISLKF